MLERMVLIVDVGNKKIQLQIDVDKCNNCGLCDRACMLTKFCGYEKIEYATEKECILCGHCVAVCPKNAIKHPKIEESIAIGEIPDTEQVTNLIKSIRSTREYRSDKLKPEHWRVISEVPRFSQTALNNQDIVIVSIESEDKLKEITNISMKMFSFMKVIYDFPLSRWFLKLIMHLQNMTNMEHEVYSHEHRKKAYEKGNDPILYGAPALILLVGPREVLTARDNANIAAQNIMMLAASLGLGSCYMGCITVGCNVLKYRPLIKALNLPKGTTVHQAMVIGYPTFKLKNMPDRKKREIKMI